VIEEIWFRHDVDEGEPASASEDGGAKPALAEPDVEYSARRARQEQEPALSAASPRAAMAHRYLAAAYASRISGPNATLANPDRSFDRFG
jgi:hypothetical protein